MIKNGIGNIYVIIFVRLGIQGNEFFDGDIVLLIVVCVVFVFVFVCFVVGVVVIGFEIVCLFVGFVVLLVVMIIGLCVMLIGVGSVGVVVVIGSMFIVNVVKEIVIFELGYYINCKRWDLVGGFVIIEIIDVNGDYKKIFYFGGGIVFGLINGYYYDCVD